MSVRILYSNIIHVHVLSAKQEFVLDLHEIWGGGRYMYISYLQKSEGIVHSYNNPDNFHLQP